VATLTVGAGERFSSLSAAIAVSQDGDVIKVAAGTYTNDFATITTNITVEGVGGMVHLLATVPPPDGKAILTINADVTLYNMEFSSTAGAAVADGNGAGIRYEGGNLVLDHTYFHDNQDGLLGDPAPGGTITIKNSEFAHNGSGTGDTHNLYVGAIATLTIDNSYFHDAVVGHEIKSRAANNIITNSRIAEGPLGDGSYDIDLPNGGAATIQHNVIEKGPNAANFYFIEYGEEGTVAGITNQLTVTGNTVLNDRSTARFVHDLVGGNSVSITGNQIYTGSNGFQIYDGPDLPDTSSNTFLATEPAFDTSDPFKPPLTFTFAVCFAGGTRVLSAAGEIAVEQLRPGDQVVTLANGNRVLRPVKWVGYRRIDLSAHPRPDSVMPIRIARGAIVENVPHRDLLLSPDHALYLDGVLILARQLINGRTIHRDGAIRVVRYFHVELDAHAILLAEGMPAESYLDTGNRGFFVNSAVPVLLHPVLSGEGSELRVAGSCAPFHAEESTVRPIWRRLADRAVQMGYGEDPCATTTSPELRVSARDRPVRAAYVQGGRHVFVLPGDLAEVRLLSRAAAPADCRPWLDDLRTLGVPVGRIVLRGGGNLEEVPLDHPALRDGWWAVEHDGSSLTRWTDGDALLPLPDGRGPIVLEIHLTGEMVYPRLTESPRAEIVPGKRA
jgi:hypothetical protein